MEEIWKDIQGYEGLYQVSNLGRVKSLKFKKDKMLNGGNNGNGYLFVGLSKNNKVKNHYVHRLVAIHFIENHDNLPEVNHIKESEKWNNAVTNLEWCTHDYNMNYGTLNERMAKSLTGRNLSHEAKQKMSKVRKGKNKGTKNPYARSVICLTTGDIYLTLTEAKEKTHASVPNISLCCKNKVKSAGKHPVTGEKLVWMYYEEYLKNQESV